MPENNEDTIRIDGKKVEREVGEAFKTFVMKKYGKIRGVFSDEVTKALAMYLREVKKNKENIEAREEKKENIASWGWGGDENKEQVYLAIEEMLRRNGLIYCKTSTQMALVSGTEVAEIKVAIHEFLRMKQYFDMLCQRGSLLVLDDESVIETSTLKE